MSSGCPMRPKGTSCFDTAAKKVSRSGPRGHQSVPEGRLDGAGHYRVDADVERREFEGQVEGQADHARFAA